MTRSRPPHRDRHHAYDLLVLHEPGSLDTQARRQAMLPYIRAPRLSGTAPWRHQAASGPIELPPPSRTGRPTAHMAAPGSVTTRFNGSTE